MTIYRLVFHDPHRAFCLDRIRVALAEYRTLKQQRGTETLRLAALARARRWAAWLHTP